MAGLGQILYSSVGLLSLCQRDLGTSTWRPFISPGADTREDIKSGKLVHKAPLRTYKLMSVTMSAHIRARRTLGTRTQKLELGWEAMPGPLPKGPYFYGPHQEQGCPNSPTFPLIEGFPESSSQTTLSVVHTFYSDSSKGVLTPDPDQPLLGPDDSLRKAHFPSLCTIDSSKRIWD